ncbi:MAG: protein kinase [Gemmatimonadetes bacterium]|nr:protein kinase [Gemmatimonadota bacterium]
MSNRLTALGTTLGRYTLLSRLGAGGMGEVWRAHDANLDREVAIKLLAPGTAADATTTERFRREALALSRLSHPGVATIYDFDAQDGTAFLVMELVSGGSLETRLASGPLPIDEVAQIGAAIADAIAEAHQCGILHRDLKPANIVLTPAGAPKILDFGIARLMGSHGEASKLTQTGMLIGSLPYMAPEQLTGDADDSRTDIYALGVMLFEMATGRRPFLKERPEALMFEIFGSAPPAVRSLRADAPAALDELIDACLSKDPARRPATATAVAAALRSLGSGTSSGPVAVPGRDTIRAIAVLPLRNVSGDPVAGVLRRRPDRGDHLRPLADQGAAGDLAHLGDEVQGSTKTLPEIARELNVDAVLEGSALLLGDRVRVSVQLVSARSDQTLWADRYDRQLEDVLGLRGQRSRRAAHSRGGRSPRATAGGQRRGAP